MHARQKQGGEIKTKKRPCHAHTTKINMEGKGLGNAEMKTSRKRDSERRRTKEHHKKEKSDEKDKELARANEVLV